MKVENYKSKYFLIVILFAVFGLNTYVSAKELPLVLRDLKCSPQKEFNKCFQINGNKGIPLIAKGDPDYGIPNMMPLIIPFMNLISTPTLHINLTNIEVHGLDKSRIVGSRIDMGKGLFIVTLRADNITVVGDYSADGKILIMPLKGKGRIRLYFKNGKYRSTLFTKIIDKEGEQYVSPEDSRLEAQFERITFDLENLFEGNKQLGDQVNTFLNENWESLVRDFGPGIEDIVAKIIMDICEDIASVVPIKNIYL